MLEVARCRRALLLLRGRRGPLAVGARRTVPPLPPGREEGRRVLLLLVQLLDVPRRGLPRVRVLDVYPLVRPLGKLAVTVLGHVLAQADRHGGDAHESEEVEGAAAEPDGHLIVSLFVRPFQEVCLGVARVVLVLHLLGHLELLPVVADAGDIADALVVAAQDGPRCRRTLRSGQPLDDIVNGLERVVARVKLRMDAGVAGGARVPEEEQERRMIRVQLLLPLLVVLAKLRELLI